MRDNLSLAGFGGRAMDEMAKHGNGTYDADKKQWKVRTKELKASATIRQLAEMFGVDLPNDERKTRPYWLKYLKIIRAKKAAELLGPTPIPARIDSIERFITEFKEQGRDTAALEKELAEAKAVPHWDIEQADVPSIHPDMRQAAELLALDGADGEITRRVLNSIADSKAIPKNESLKVEIDSYIEGYKKKGNKQWYDIKRALDLLYEATGHVRLTEITLDHYRRFLELLDREQKSEGWSQQTKQNRQRVVHTFLKNLEADRGLWFPFIRNKKYQIDVPPVVQTKYELEQVKLALQHATGDQRLALLLGLNCGFYWSDIAELQPKHFDGSHITKARAKNKRGGVQKGFMSRWKLWPETVGVLKYGFDPDAQKEEYKQYRGRLERAYQQLRGKYNLPEHMALRKTVAQWIQEVSGEEESRILYRAEGYGTHYSSYVCNLTAAQVEKLDKALDKVREKVFGVG